MAKGEAHCCIDCARANLFQYDFDPIIAECFNGERNVARYPVVCKYFLSMDTMDKKEKRFIRCIEVRKKKIGI